MTKLPKIPTHCGNDKCACRVFTYLGGLTLFCELCGWLFEME
jgi:hypothetical protein